MSDGALAIGVPDGTLTANTVGAGPTVLLIHGTAPAIWGELPSLLSPAHRVVSYDRRSFGASRHLPAAGLTLHADDAAAVIRATEGPATIVGWSIGGVIALEVAARHPDIVESMVLLEPPLWAKRHPRPRMIAAIGSATVLGKLGRPEAGARRFLRWALGHRNGTSDLDRLPAEWHARLTAGDGAAVVNELAGGTGEHLDAERLSAIGVPVHVLRGDTSQPAFADAAERVKNLVSGAVLDDVTGSGHALQLDAPKRVVASVSAVRN